MSRVTGVMLICSLSDSDDIIPEINAWLAEREYSDGSWYLAEISDHAGGSKHPQFAAWSGGFNWFEDQVEPFAEFVMTRDWYSDENLVLICENEEQATKVFRPKRWAQVTGIEPEQPPPKLGPPDFRRWL